MRIQSLPLLLVAAAAIGAAPQPPLDALKGFQAGLWQVKPIGELASSTGSNLCVADPNILLTGGRPAADCTFSIITSQPDTAVVTYRCEGGRSGRTQLRRDTDGLFKVDAQGLDGGLPFAARSEWRRTGAC